MSMILFRAALLIPVDSLITLFTSFSESLEIIDFTDRMFLKLASVLLVSLR